MIEKNEGESTVFENIIKEARKQDTSIKKYLLAHFLCFSISCSILWKNIIVNLRYNDNDQESSNTNMSDLNNVYFEWFWDNVHKSHAKAPDVLVVHAVEVGHVAVGRLLIVVVVPEVNNNIFP